MRSKKPWQETPLRFPKKAILVLDNQASRAATCAGKIIEHFSCQSARATTEEEFIKLLKQATKEGCEITGIIADNGMATPGSDIIDSFLEGHYNQYYQQSSDPELSKTACLVITGDQDLNFRGEAGLHKTLVLNVSAWREFLREPATSAVGVLVGSWLNVDPPNLRTDPISEARLKTKRFGSAGAAAYMESVRGGHNSEADYIKRARCGNLGQYRPI